MLSLKIDEKKNKIYKIAIAIIIILVLFLLYYFFIASSDRAAVDPGDGSGQGVIAGKKLEIKKINLDILNNDIFSKLNDYQLLNKNISQPVTGNKNPFASTN